MHCHCGTNNRAPRWTFTDPYKPEVRPGAREESASPARLAASAMNARDTTKVYIWTLDTGCGPTLYRKCHSHKTPGKRHNNTWVEQMETSVRPMRSLWRSYQTSLYEFSYYGIEQHMTMTLPTWRCLFNLAYYMTLFKPLLFMRVLGVVVWLSHRMAKFLVRTHNSIVFFSYFFLIANSVCSFCSLFP